MASKQAETETKNKAITVTFSPDVLEKMNAKSVKEDRSFSNTVNVSLREYFELKEAAS